MVSSHDKYILYVAVSELENVLRLPELKADVPVLLLANKSDIAGGAGIGAVVDKIGKAVASRKYHIQVCNALSGDGLYEGLEWVKSVSDRPVRTGAALPAFVREVNSSGVTSSSARALMIGPDGSGKVA